MNEILYMKMDMVKNMALYLLRDGKESTMESALNTVLHSQTYINIMDSDAKLYYQSPRYVYSFLTSELNRDVLVD